MVSHNLKCIFVHIPKCGGISIKKILTSVEYYNYSYGEYLISKLPESEYAFFEHHTNAVEFKSKCEYWKDYFKFAFVRNTWDRLASYYFYCKKKQIQKADSMNFEAWVQRFVGSGKYPGSSQMFWIETEPDKIELDFIGKFENFEKDFQYVCRKLKIQADLPHINKTRHKHYSVYYSDALADFVAEKCAVEIKYFNFKFERKVKKFL